jgi:amino acid adenylation domain-containing protein
MSILDATQKRALAAELLRRKAQRARPCALSAAQYRLWLLHELDPGASTYNVPCAFDVRGNLDADALRRALRTLVRRHDVLRATFTVVAGEPAYVVHADARVDVPIVDVSEGGEYAAYIAGDGARGFDLRREFPLRAVLLRRAADWHVLLVTMHHIATDGWSMGVFKRELGASYAAYAAGEAPAPSEPPCTYADVVAWQQAERADPAFARHAAYWDAELRAAPLPLAFGAAPLAGDAASSTGALRSRRLDGAAAARLARVCGRHGTTIFSTLLAAFALLLERYTGQSDLIVGCAFAGRAQPEFEELIGFFVNTLPLRMRVDDTLPLDAWLADVHARCIDAFDHQDVPLQQLVEAARPARLGARTPLINVMFVVNNAPDGPLELAGLAVTPLDVPRTTAKFDLTLEVTPHADGLRFGLEYRSALFEPDTIDGMLDALATLVAAFDGDPARSVAELPLASDAAQRHALALGNAAARPALTGMRIERLFEAQCARRPHAIAVVDGTRRTTYAQLDARANRLARYLQSAGVAPGARVGAAFERGTDAIVALLAILKAGAAYVPLDPTYPRARLAHMLVDTGAALVLTQRRCARALRELPVDVLEVDADAARFAQLPATAVPGERGGAHDVAYVMYTSGSTGTPKGVLVPHQGIERLVTAIDYASIAADDTVAHAAPLAFDASTFEIWGPLLNGARLAVIAHDELLAPAALRAAFERDAVTLAFLTTALAREIARRAPATFAPLRTLLVGGEALDPQTASAILAHAPRTQLRNIYGPTETTTFATSHRIDAPPRASVVPIGRPIVNTHAHVLDRRRRPLPPGAVGELYIGGPGVALGYLGDPTATAAKFVADPFSGIAGARLYATGDRACFAADGTLMFLGRDDGQIKRRGFRIEPGEIEAVLRAQPAVDDAAVIVVRADADSDPRLIACVAVAPASTDVATLNAALRLRLPAHALPDALELLDALPLKPNGKVDRAALAERRRGAPAAASADAPRTEAEAALRALWEELLPVRPVGVHDDFFALGGHSLLALRLLAEIERRHAVRVAPAVLFAQPTIAQLARAMCDDSADPARDALLTLNAAGSRRALFFFHGSIGGGGFYCRALADRMGTERPFHVLRPHDESHELPSIDAMAAAACATIARVQPHGPYLLGGYCNGGLVAYATARRLRAAGERVENVVLVDVPPARPRLRRALDGLDRGAARLGVSAARRSALRGWLARLPCHWERFVLSPNKRRHLGRGAGAALRRAGAAFSGAPTAASRPESPLDPWIEIIEAYLPPPYDGRLTLLLTNDDAPGVARGWSTVVPRCDVHALAGTHASCITEFIGDTAQVFAAVLADEP